MRWKATPDPQTFERRDVVKFALVPTKIDDEWIWLESYAETFEFGIWFWHSQGKKKIDK